VPKIDAQLISANLDLQRDQLPTSTYDLENDPGVASLCVDANEGLPEPKSLFGTPYILVCYKKGNESDIPVILITLLEWKRNNVQHT
jgi:hypothetical protein